MADYHVLASDERHITCAFHFPVPASNNVAGKAWSTCIVEAAGGAITSAIPTGHLGVGEAAALAAGTLYEEIVAVPYNDGLSNAAKQALVEAMYSARAVTIAAELARRFRFWGFSGEVA